MSEPIDPSEITSILLSLREEGTNVIQWSYFTVAAKKEIVRSASSFDSFDKMRAFWIRTVSNIAATNGYNLATARDNWFLIERELQLTFPSTSAPQVPQTPQAPSSPALLPTAPTACKPRSTSKSRTSSKSSSPKSKRRSSTASDSDSPKSQSSLGVSLSASRKKESLCIYNSYKDENKWRLQSGRFVENIMASFVSDLEYDHPSVHCILDMSDDNWEHAFSDEEREEINQIAEADIKYPQLPHDMEAFLCNIPDTSNLLDMYDHLEGIKLNLNQPDLVYLKTCFQQGIRLLQYAYLPLSDQLERDICANVWGIFPPAFESSVMKYRMEARSAASQQANFKRRKIAGCGRMARQASTKIPDMTISKLNQEYAVIEAAKSSMDTKEINEGGKKLPEMMVDIFDQLLSTCPNAQRQIKVHGCLLSKLVCMPVELSNPKGYVKIYKRSKALQYPEDPNIFKAKMSKLLAHIWKLRLATEAVYKIMVEAENQQSQFVSSST